ncbi:helix-turn-helix domain-containing protein [Solicola gregarius]|uniref:Helix-turn-helix domain-containing protein n=1 Tax=Solicola gregarius TaxID=2908642 RepID=A0AA46TMM9_9ACTN|nr:helix-turn-helix domain-containing protein [Solicola gregarius]UYM07938.1 helix-turn-helix domain-containing protein [Solicola gregarius]
MRNVATIVTDGVEPFGLGLFCEVWGEEEHPEDGAPAFDFAVCGPQAGRIRGSNGFDLFVEHGLERVAEADLVAVCPTTQPDQVPQSVLDAIRDAHARGATILTHCTGAFVLGAAGMLDGRRCATHWRHADRLAAAFPDAKVDADVLYVDDDRVFTGAGCAAGIDACLHLVRMEFGAKVAGAFARRIVVPPQRDGGQAQFVRTPIVEQDADTLQPLLEWARAHLEEDLAVDVLARRALMSPRTFARRFRDETGTTPHQWVTHQRLALAEQLLEDTLLGIDEIAGRAGFGNAATLRHHFSAVRGTTPADYRRTFGCVEAS